MTKTYLYIPDSLNEKINYTARLQGKSKAEIMRQSLEKGIKAVQQASNGSSAEILTKLSDLGKKYKLKGPKDSSARIDELLWEKDWSQSE